MIGYDECSSCGGSGDERHAMHADNFVITCVQNVTSETTDLEAKELPQNIADRGGSGTSQMGANGVATSPAGRGAVSRIASYNNATELRILLVYLSESLGRLDQNGGGHSGPHFS